MKLIPCYIEGTLNVGLKFEQKHQLDQLIGYANFDFASDFDFDFASDFDKHLSTTWPMFTLIRGPVSWRSTL